MSGPSRSPSAGLRQPVSRRCRADRLRVGQQRHLIEHHPQPLGVAARGVDRRPRTSGPARRRRGRPSPAPARSAARCSRCWMAIRSGSAITYRRAIAFSTATSARSTRGTCRSAAYRVSGPGPGRCPGRGDRAGGEPAGQLAGHPLDRGVGDRPGRVTDAGRDHRHGQQVGQHGRQVVRRLVGESLRRKRQRPPARPGRPAG